MTQKTVMAYIQVPKGSKARIEMSNDGRNWARGKYRKGPDLLAVADEGWKYHRVLVKKIAAT